MGASERWINHLKKKDNIATMWETAKDMNSKHKEHQMAVWP
jgi:hypothetical protein